MTGTISPPLDRVPPRAGPQPPGGIGEVAAPDRRATALAVGLLALTLLGSLPLPFKVPFLGVSLQNLAVPLGCLALAFWLWPLRARVWRSARPLLPATIALVAWGLAVSVLSEHPEVSLRYWVKYLAYLVAFAGFLFVFATPSLHLPAYLTAYGFLAGLALMGVVEVAFPDSGVFSMFRSAGSLQCRPRIAALLPSPNTYGALMVLALAIGERLHARRLLPRAVDLAAVLLFITQVAQSGSRNAWLALAGALLWMVVRRLLSPWRAGALAAGFALSLVVLPVPARQAGIKPPAVVPQATFLVGKGDLKSAALCPAKVSFGLRLALWRGGLSELRRRPLEGIGIGVFARTAGLRVMHREGFDTHNLPLGILVETGLVGLVLSGVWLATALRRWPAASDLAEVAVAVVMGAQVFDFFIHDHTYTTLAVLAWASFVSPWRDA